MNPEHTIYGLTDPRSGEIRYVGKTVEPEQRLYTHLWYARSGGHAHRDRWIRCLLAEGVEPTMVVLEVVEAGDWQKRERHWIAELPNLTNISAGGDGVEAPRTQEWKDRIGASHRGKIISEETRKKIREANPYTHRTHCSKGHAYTTENTYYNKRGNRCCRACGNEKAKRYYRQKHGGLKGREKQVCKRGHPMEGENLRLLVRKNRTERICRECVRIRNREAGRRKRAKLRNI